MDGKALSIETAKRLKEERQNKSLSHVALSNKLKEAYGIDISKDSLQNYEVATESHTKSFANNGMRVEYLRCFADFYGVSTDYLLGLSDIRSCNETLQDIHSKTGLSQSAIIKLMVDRIAGDSSGVELISYLACKDLERLSDTIKAVNHFLATPKNASLDIDGTDYDIEMSELYRVIANKILWDLLKEYK